MLVDASKWKDKAVHAFLALWAIAPLELPAAQAQPLQNHSVDASEAVADPSNPYLQTSPFASHVRDGVGLIKMYRGRPVDVAASAPSDNGYGGPTEVGFGLRQENMTAVIGYVRPNPAAQADGLADSERAQTFRPRSTMGLGVSLHF